MEVQRSTFSVRLVAGLIWVVLLGAVLYFSWIPNPKLADSPILPWWLGQWADTFDRLRTGVPFVVLGGIGQAVLFPGRGVTLWLGLVLLILGVEYGQTYIPHRIFDWLDIFWAAVGSLLGQVMGAASRRYWVKRAPYKV